MPILPDGSQYFATTRTFVWVHHGRSSSCGFWSNLERDLSYVTCTVYPKKYAHGSCFVVFCCGYTLTDFPIFIRLTSLALWQSNDCPSVSKATLMNMHKYFIWVHYERLHNHNKAKHNKTVCIFLGIHCIRGLRAFTSTASPFPAKHKQNRTASEPLWRHQMETISSLLAICVGNLPVTGGFPSQRPVTWSFDVFFDLRPNNDWSNKRNASDLSRHRAHYDVTVMTLIVRRAGLLWSQQDFEWRWSVPLFKCLTVLEFSFILFDLCFLITFFNFIMNYVPLVTFWIFTYHKIWILSMMFCFIWSFWIVYFLACLEVSWRVMS